MSLSDQEKNRYSRHILLEKVGLKGQELLQTLVALAPLAPPFLKEYAGYIYFFLDLKDS